MLRQYKKLKKFIKSISLLVILSMVMPLVSWSFDQDLFWDQYELTIKLGQEGSRQLADDYRIPAYIGQITEASYQAGGKTLVLIQDLHCNYDVQQNIRAILNRVTRKQDGMKLVAVEGASGIIPTLDLGLIKNTPAKKAVTDYFMQQGKLTGADCFAICDDLSVELYGSEDESLYSNSIDLIKSFCSDQNRGIVLELLDQVHLAKKSILTGPLADFDKTRLDFYDGRMTEEAYQNDLIQLAKKYQVDTYPQPLQAFKTKRSLNYHEKQAQQHYLEQQLLEKLTTTEEEKELMDVQHYVELIDRIINIAASPQDLQTYQSMSSNHSLAKVNHYLNRVLGDQAIDLKDDLKQFTGSIKQGLDFYGLAEKRNDAIFHNVLARLNKRDEQAAVIVTGGFHTKAISRLAKEQGHSIVAIRPQYSGQNADSNYYDLLLHPDRQTEFEQMIVQNYKRQSAIAAINYLISTPNKIILADMIDLTRKAFDGATNQVWKVGSLTMTKVSSRLVRITKDGKTFYLDLKNKLSIQDQGEREQVLKIESAKGPFSDQLFKSKVMQSIIVFVTFSTAFTYYPQFGIGHYFIWNSAPLLLAAAMTVLLFLVAPYIWKAGLAKINQSCNILYTALYMGLLLLAPFIGSSSSEYFKVMLMNGDIKKEFARTFSISRVTSELTARAMDGLPFLRNVKPRVKKDTRKGGVPIFELKNAINRGPAAVARGFVSLSSLRIAERVINAALVGNTKAIFGTSFDRLDGRLLAAQAKIDDQINNGDPVPDDYEGDPDHIIYITKEIVALVLGGLNNLGLGTLVDILGRDYYKEPQDGYEVELGPLAMQMMDGYSLAAFVEMVKDGEEVSKAAKEFIERAYKKSKESGNPNTDSLFIPRLIFRHPRKRPNFDYNYRIISDLLPNELKKELDKNRGAGYYDSLFDEIVSPEEREALREKMDMILELTEDDDFEISFELALYILIHGIIHEIIHPLILHFPTERPKELSKQEEFYTEDDLFRLLQVNYLSRLTFKNWIKSMQGTKTMREKLAKIYPEEFSEPTVETQNAICNANMTEDSCDFFGMFLFRKALGENINVFESVFEEEMIDELKGCFEWYLGYLQRLAKEDKLMVFSEEHRAKSRMIAARSFTAAALVPVPGDNGAKDIAMNLLGIKTKENAKEEGLVTIGTSSLVNRGPNYRTQSNDLSGSETGINRKPKKKRPKIQGTATMSLGKPTNKFSKIVTTQKNRDNSGFLSNQGDNNQSLGRLYTETLTQPSTEPSLNETATLEAINEVIAANTAPEANQDLRRQDPNAPGVPDGMYERQLDPNILEDPNPLAVPVPVQISEGLVLPSKGSQTIPIPEGVETAQGASVQTEVVLTGLSEAVSSVLRQTGALTALMGDQISQIILWLASQTGGARGIANQAVTIAMNDNSKLAKQIESGAAGSATTGGTRNLNIVNNKNSFTDALNQATDSGKQTVIINTQDNTGDSGSYHTLRLTNQGTITIAENVSAISMREAQKIINRRDTDGKKLFEVDSQYKAMFKQYHDPKVLKELFFINPESLNKSQQELLRNFDLNRKVSGMRELTSQEKMNIPVAALIQALQPAFKSGETEMTVRVDIEKLNQLNRLASSGNENVVFATTSVVVKPEKETGYSVNKAFLDAMFFLSASQSAQESKRQAVIADTAAEDRKKTLKDDVAKYMEDNTTLLEQSLGFVDDLFNMMAEGVPVVFEAPMAEFAEALGSEEGMMPIDEKTTLLRTLLEENLGKEYAAKLMPKQLEAMIAEFGELNTMTIVMPAELAISMLERYHAESWLEEPSLFQGFSPLELFMAPGRTMLNPLANTQEVEREIQKTGQQKADAFYKLRAAILLALASGYLIITAIKKALTTSPQKDMSRASQFAKFLRNSGFWDAIKIMYGVIIGSKKVTDKLSTVVRNQLYDLQLMEKAKQDFVELTLEQIEKNYPSLTSRHAQFQQFATSLKTAKINVVFRFFQRILGIRDLNLLYQDLFILRSKSDEMEKAMYYISTAETLRANFVEQSLDRNLDGIADSGSTPRMANNFLRPLDEARARIEEIRKEFLVLKNAGATDQQRMSELSTERKDLLFSIYIQRALDKLAIENSPKNINVVMLFLVKQLRRTDVSVDYHKDVLQLLSLFDPYNQRAVKIVMEDESVVDVMLPRILIDTIYRDRLLNIYPGVYDENNKLLLPIKRREQRQGTSA